VEHDPYDTSWGGFDYPVEERTSLICPPGMGRESAFISYINEESYRIAFKVLELLDLDKPPAFYDRLADKTVSFSSSYPDTLPYVGKEKKDSSAELDSEEIVESYIPDDEITLENYELNSEEITEFEGEQQGLKDEDYDKKLDSETYLESIAFKLLVGDCDLDENIIRRSDGSCYPIDLEFTAGYEQEDVAEFFERHVEEYNFFEDTPSYEDLVAKIEEFANNIDLKKLVNKFEEDELIEYYPDGEGESKANRVNEAISKAREKPEIVLEDRPCELLES